jgi:hypothetical protein
MTRKPPRHDFLRPVDSEATIGPFSASIATLSGSVRSIMIHLMSEKAPRRGRISAGRKARAVWEDPPAELLLELSQPKRNST